MMIWIEPFMKKINLLAFIATAFSMQACMAEQTQPTVLETPKTKQLENVDFSKQDLAQTLGIKSSLIETVQYESIIWNNGALGCPKLGQQYTQGQLAGFRIVLKVNGTQYNYHASDKGVPFLCPKANIKKPTPLYQDR